MDDALFDDGKPRKRRSAAAQQETEAFNPDPGEEVQYVPGLATILGEEPLMNRDIL